MTGRSIEDLLTQLSERDLAVLRSLQSHRLLTTVLIRRLHFPYGPGQHHTSQTAASAATMRVLTRLETRGLVARLHRRIGGVRAGSSGIVWQLGASGERLLRTLHGGTYRRRYLEPTTVFANHTLAVADLAVRLRELERRGQAELIIMETEPDSWRTYVAPHGGRAWLKPDLFAVTATGDYEHHWFIEADRATEHPGVILRKCLAYQQYQTSGSHQAAHGLFPIVLWVVPDSRRQHAITDALSNEAEIRRELFQVITNEQFDGHISGENAPNDYG